MEGFTKNVINKKNRKFEKDKRAFANGKAYRWNNRYILGRTRFNAGLRDSEYDRFASSSGTETDMLSTSLQVPICEGSNFPSSTRNPRKCTGFGGGLESRNKDKKSKRLMVVGILHRV